MQEHGQVIISATSKEEARNIARMLVDKRLIAGALIINGPSIYWWKKEIVEEEYYNVQAWTLLKHKQEIIAEVEKMHKDETPITAFIKIEGNEKFLKWIEEEVKQ